MKNNINTLTPKHFPSSIRAASFFSEGGCPESKWGLNVSESVDDAPKAVAENKKRITQYLGFEKLVDAAQCHSTHIAQVFGDEGQVSNCDGLICTTPQVLLMVKHADCQGALFVDPQKKIVGAAHAGWRGQIEGMYEKMICAFEALGSSPKDLLVYLSPSLGPCHSEFKNYEEEFPEKYWRFVQDYHADLWQLAQQQLETAGVLKTHIEMAQVCSYCDPRCFSHRRAQGQLTGRMASCIGIL